MEWVKWGEYGKVSLYIDDFIDLFINVENDSIMWMSYGDFCVDLLMGFEIFVYMDNIFCVAIVDY